MATKDKPFLKIIPRGSILYILVKFLLIPLIALVVLFFLADSVIMPKIVRHGEEFPLPNVVGMSMTDAVAMFNEVGVELEIAGEEQSPDLPEGTVITQTPTAGSMVKKGRRIKTIISAGRKMVTVPDMIGFSQRQTELKLNEAGLKIGSFNWTSSDSLPVNVLVYSVPSAGSIAPKGTPVNLYFNRGAQTNVVFVPQLVGMSLDEAKYVIDSLGLNISKVDYAVNAELLPNTVIWQSQRPGTKLEYGLSIQLKVSITD